MSLIFRLVSELLRSKFGETTQIGEEIIVRFRVMPTDLDFNGHMTNNRYHTIMDYAALRLLGSHGILAVMLKKRWRPIVGCSLISHRKSLKMFDRYRVRSKIIYCDEAWSYLSHIIECNGQIIAAANRKYALLGKNGLITSENIFSEIGEDFTRKPSNIDSIRSWIEAEKTVLKHSQIGNINIQGTHGKTIIECKNNIPNTIVRTRSNEAETMPCLYSGLECAQKVGCSTQEEQL